MINSRQVCRQKEERSVRVSEHEKERHLLCNIKTSRKEVVVDLKTRKCVKQISC